MDGATLLGESDLSGGGFGIGWGHTRCYGNLLSSNVGGWNGNSVMVREAEWLAFVSPSTVCVVRDMQSSLWFDLVGGTWVPRYGVHATLTGLSSSLSSSSSSSGIDQYVLFEEESGTSRYFGADGSLVRIVAPGGVEARLTYAGGALASFEVAQGGMSARYVYEYNSSGLLGTVTQQTVANAIPTPVRRALYTYFGAGDSRGCAGDLASVEIQMWCSTNGMWMSVSRSGYR